MMVNLTMASHPIVMCSLIRNCDTYSFLRYMVVQSVPSVCLAHLYLSVNCCISLAHFDKVFIHCSLRPR